MWNRTLFILQIALAAGPFAIPAQMAGAKLEPEAVRVFDRYVHAAEESMQMALDPGAAFLWVDSLPTARRDELHMRLRRGEVVTQRLATRNPAVSFNPPKALIHDWGGTIFVPGVSLQQILTLLRDYDHHFTYYSPVVTKSKILERLGDDFKVYLRLTQKKVLTVVLDTEYQVRYQRIDANHAESRSYSTRIVEVQHAGSSNEYAMLEGNDDGFLWRLNSYWRFFEADGGVYVQCEAISLTRDIPTGLNWLIGPFIESIPRESLEFTLQATRAATLRRDLHASQ